jgi:aspartyl-tRNA(Asn)/glutamyl-tRNA(Gln) amidotransferase subunit B
MQEGSMRCDVNVSVRKKGETLLGERCEIKNVNSMKFARQAIEFEVKRQVDLLESGQQVTRETLNFNPATGVTTPMRDKESAHDYRYFPDPDLVPVIVSDEWLGRIQGRLGELPLAMQHRFVTDFGLSDYDAGVLTAEKATGEFFDAAVRCGGDPKRVCNLLTQTGLKLANQRQTTADGLGVSPENLAMLAKMADAGQISASAAAVIFEEMALTGADPMQVAEQKNLLQKSDAGEIETLVEQVVAENAQAVEDARTNPKKAKKAIGFLMGQVIQKSKGQANPRIVSEILSRKLSL